MALKASRIAGFHTLGLSHLVSGETTLIPANGPQKRTPNMLTEKQIRALKPREKEYSVSDGRTARGEGVLVLRVRPNGAKEFYYQRRIGEQKSKRNLFFISQMQQMDR